MNQSHMENECPACQSSVTDSYFCSDNRLLKCRNCELIFLTNYLWAINEDSEYYKHARNYIQAMKVESRILTSQKASGYLIRKIKRYITFTPKIEWLDVGANYGVLVSMLKEQGIDAVGVDLNKELVAKATEQGIPVYQGDAIEYAKSSNKNFDVVSAIDLLEHLSRPRDFLNSVQNIIKDNGLLILEVPNIDSYLSQKHTLQWKYVDREHISYFSPKSISDLLNECGFCIEKIEYHNPFLSTFSITKLSHYIFPRALSGDRLQNPPKGLVDTCALNESPTDLYFSGLRKFIRKILIYSIVFLKREDFILVIAKKKSV